LQSCHIKNLGQDFLDLARIIHIFVFFAASKKELKVSFSEEANNLKFNAAVKTIRQVLKNSVGDPIDAFRLKSDTLLDNHNLGIFHVPEIVPIKFRQLAHKILKNYCIKVYKEYPGIEVDYTKLKFIHLKLYNYGDSKKKMVYYTYGGDWYFKNPESYSTIISDLFKESGSTFGAIRYRKIPEFSAFECLEDSLAGYLYLTSNNVNSSEGCKGSGIVIMADSAGAALATQVVHFLRNTSLDLPADSLLWSPYLDLTGSQPSEYIIVNKCYIQGHLKKPIIRGNMAVLTGFWALPYLGADEKDKRKMEFEGSIWGPKQSNYWPLLSPMLDPDLKGLPPILLVISYIDTCRNYGLVYARRLFEQQKNPKGILAQQTTHIYENMPHGFDIAPFAPPRDQYITQASNFIKFAYNPQFIVSPYTIQDRIATSKFGKVPELSKDRFEAYFISQKQLKKSFDLLYKINPYEIWNLSGVDYMVNHTSLLFSCNFTKLNFVDIFSDLFIYIFMNMR
jgi:acetyl esterase/lipase